MEKKKAVALTQEELIIIDFYRNLSKVKKKKFLSLLSSLQNILNYEQL